MEEVPHKTTDAVKAWEAWVSALLEDPTSLSIEASIAKAVENGSLSPEEGQQCLNDYLAAFLNEHEVD